MQMNKIRRAIKRLDATEFQELCVKLCLPEYTVREFAQGKATADVKIVMPLTNWFNSK